MSGMRWSAAKHASAWLLSSFFIFRAKSTDARAAAVAPLDIMSERSNDWSIPKGGFSGDAACEIRDQQGNVIVSGTLDEFADAMGIKDSIDRQLEQDRLEKERSSWSDLQLVEYAAGQQDLTETFFDVLDAAGLPRNIITSLTWGLIEGRSMVDRGSVQDESI